MNTGVVLELAGHGPSPGRNNTETVSMKLYHNPASPFVRKVRVVASECGVTDQLHLEEIALTPVSTPDVIAAENPLGKIPSLVLDNDLTLFDSRVICEYLDTEFNGGLIPASGAPRWSALRLQSIADGFCDAAVLVRYEGFVRPEDKQWNEWVEGQLHKCRRSIDLLEKECAGFGNEITIGSLSVAIALGYFDFRNSDEKWRERAPALATWYEKFSQRPSLTETQPA